MRLFLLELLSSGQQVQSSSAIPRMLNIWPQKRFSGCAGCSRFNGQSGKIKSTRIQPKQWWHWLRSSWYYNDNESIVGKSYIQRAIWIYMIRYVLFHGWSTGTESLNAMTSRSERQFHTGEASQDIFTILSPIVEAARWRPSWISDLMRMFDVLRLWMHSTSGWKGLKRLQSCWGI